MDLTGYITKPKTVFTLAETVFLLSYDWQSECWGWSLHTKSFH